MERRGGSPTIQSMKNIIKRMKSRTHGNGIGSKLISRGFSEIEDAQISEK